MEDEGEEVDPRLGHVVRWRRMEDGDGEEGQSWIGDWRLGRRLGGRLGGTSGMETNSCESASFLCWRESRDTVKRLVAQRIHRHHLDIARQTGPLSETLDFSFMHLAIGGAGHPDLQSVKDCLF